MGAAAVLMKEIDLTTRVASFAGVYGAIVVPAKKGQTDRPSLVTSDTQFLNRYTPDGAVKVGYDMSYFSALSYLERSNKLWVRRVVNGAFYAGLILKASSSAQANTGIGTGTDLADPTAITFDADDDALLIYGANQGAWANSISIKVVTVVSNPELVEPDSFQIKVFKSSNLNVPVETHLVSRVQGQKDGRGRNMFVEDVLQSSNYIRAISNPLIAGTVLPKVQNTALAMTDGQDGSAITDSNMVAAAQAFKSTGEYPVTILMDGGYSVPAYQIELDTIANLRQDCVAILTTPYDAEVDADYINALVDYRKTTLNLNSSYSGLYTPHLQIQDRFNDRKLWIAPDGHVAGSISFSANNYEIWYPPAGYKRGILNVLDTARRFSDGELDVLQDAGINPVRFKAGKGIVIWGQKTLLARASALDRMNVRLMLIVITPAIKDLLENWLFELGDEAERAIVELKIKSYLEGIKSRKGMYDYDVVCDDTNNSPEDIDANIMNVDVFVKPTKSIEAIPVRIVITPSNISFSTAAGAI